MINFNRMRKASGLTLLELLVAMAIFSLIASVGYMGLQQGTAFANELHKDRMYWQRLESVYLLIQMDLDLALDHGLPVQATPSFIGNHGNKDVNNDALISFTRSINKSFQPGPISPFQSVSYYFDNGILYRMVAVNTKVDVEGDIMETPILKNVDNISLRYLASGNSWVTSWPQNTDQNNPMILPEAVEINVDFHGSGAYRWLFHVGPPR